VSDHLESWFRTERDGPAPEAIVRAVAERTRATHQRRRRPAWFPGADALEGPSRRMALVPVVLGAVAGLVAIALLLASTGGPWDGRNGVVAGPLSTPTASEPSAPPSTRATPTLPTGALRFDFKVAGGVVEQVKEQALHGTLADPPGNSTARGTFVMTGALPDVGAFSETGTFTDQISYAPSGEFTVRRTMETPAGRLVAVATETLFETDTAALTLQGTWRTVGGTGSWVAVSAHGTVSGSSLGPVGALPEHWAGTVTP
jgi:hypothetical protein